MKSISAHLYHDSTLSLDLDGELRNIELERVFSKRHYDWRRENDPLDDLIELVSRENRSFDIGIMIGDRDTSAETLFRQLGVSSILQVPHHVAHAAGAFYQSPFDHSLVISYDGGGNDGTFRAFIARRDIGIRPLGVKFDLNLGIPYRALAHPIADIHKPDDGRELSNAGKLMGLAAYGQVRPEWIEPIRAYYNACSIGGAVPSQMYRWVLSHHARLSSRLGVDLSRDSLTGTQAFDLARTGQDVFERLFLERVLPLANVHRLPICISGGCALNVLTNQRLADLIDLPIFVPPNPNDCGLAVGGLLFHSKPPEAVSVTYSGTPILDIADTHDLVNGLDATSADPGEVARDLSDGRVVAVIRGNSEHGPRALGHRSFLCDPSVEGMKERLNRSIKFREQFRPYAPVVRRHDADKFFENAKHDLSFMSFNPTVRRDWRNAFAAALHVDSTARAQTIAKEQDPWLYEVLTRFGDLSGHAALLNTSFNTKGRPMVTRVSDALAVFLSTDVDCLVIDNHMFRKRSVADRSRRVSAVLPIRRDE